MTTLDNQRLAGLIDLIYGAATDPESWTRFLAAIAAALDAKSALIRTIDLEGPPRVLMSYHHNLDPNLQDEYCAHLVQLDPYLAALRRLPPGRMVTDEQVLDRRSLQSTSFYNHYMRPLDNQFIVGGFVQREETRSTIFGVHRHHGSTPFEREHLEAVQLLVPHIQRSIGLQRMLDLQTLRAESAERALDKLSIATFLLDDETRVVHANPSGDRLLRHGRGLRMRSGGHLGARDAEQCDALSALLARARAAASGNGPPAAETMLLQGDTGGSERLLAVAYPVPEHREYYRQAWPTARVALYVGDLDDTGVLRAESLATLYGLTPAETRLAMSLARGRDLQELSREWSISPHTLRTQLKAVFSKTGVRRQTELVRLLSGASWRLTAERTAKEDRHAGGYAM
ncbi:helix-turn-helix transcriptional regulator [Thiohalorhabdus sp. Cl-TMA]|uniref:Helix-turn-helix transcriptional regulator n=1 Tax=Thiohalorhabdus methylotrophus TaxID=3242694 RepID=A0ABV4TTH7_9GAMM